MVKKKLKPSLLIVDDIPTNIKVLGETLKTNYQIRLATNGFKALEIASSENPPDLILLDIMMPDMNGFEVCTKLKESKKTRNIPVIFITAMDDERDETKGLELGAVDYIKKPFSLPIVKARVKTHIELKRHRDILENLSTIDALTGLANRRRFDEYYNSEWKRSCREATLLSMIMIDIDFFKLYNDNYGHASGDECLKQVTKCLNDIVNRPADLLARYGGEEFVCILPKTNIHGTIQIGEMMRDYVEKLYIPHQHSIITDHVTISLGAVTLLPKETIAADVLLEGADKCLYQAKASGRNQIISYDLDIGLEVK
ncbi:MAG: diguanylate cyclase [Deltaproteobacteria bacterium]|jgi:diguanylate cyclase (GGDEF)-like protein|nr:diguanylate cyclase [Deltaproteobacteria bacterium]